MRCTVLGAGSWGTALASLLAGKGYTVTSWDKDAPVLEDMARNHRNDRYLPGVTLPARCTRRRTCRRRSRAPSSSCSRSRRTRCGR